MALDSEVRLEPYRRPYSVLKLSERVIDDSEYPFAPEDTLRLRISGDHLIVERVPRC